MTQMVFLLSPLHGSLPECVDVRLPKASLPIRVDGDHLGLIEAVGRRVFQRRERSAPHQLHGSCLDSVLPTCPLTGPHPTATQNLPLSLHCELV